MIDFYYYFIICFLFCFEIFINFYILKNSVSV